MPGLTANPIPVNEHDRIFDRVFVTPSFIDFTTVSWRLDSRYAQLAASYEFFLEWAPHANAEFVEVAGPTTGNTLVDVEPRRFSKAPQSVYRVRLDMNGVSYFSSPDDGMGQWNRHDYLLARDITRREHLLAIGYTGMTGHILARRHFGTACTRCIDWNTNQPTGGDCQLCFGTGFLGGYYPASIMNMSPQPKSKREMLEQARATVADRTMACRAVSCPTLTTRDVWVNSVTSERWMVQTVAELGSIRGKAVILQVELRLIELSSVLYTVPLDGSLSSSA